MPGTEIQTAARQGVVQAKSNFKDLVKLMVEADCEALGVDL
jgi:hypothetical protein